MTTPYEHRRRAEIRRRVADALVKLADYQEQAGHIYSLTRDKASHHYAIRDEELRDSDTRDDPGRPITAAEYFHRAGLRLELAETLEQLADYQETTGSTEDAIRNRAVAADQRKQRTTEINTAEEKLKNPPPPKPGSRRLPPE